MRHQPAIGFVTALLALGLLTLAACDAGTVPTGGAFGPTPLLGGDLSAQAATATAAVFQATTEAVRRQQTVEAARAALAAREAQATAEALAATQADATRIAAVAATAVQATVEAAATARSHSDLATFTAQLTVEAGQTATASSANATSTAQAASLAATATEGALRATSTAQALSIEATGTATALQATQTAIAAALERRRETFVIVALVAAAVVAAAVIAVALLGWGSLMQRRVPDASDGMDSEILQQGPCPPVTVLPDGTVHIPLLSPSERSCTLSREQLDEVLDWSRAHAPDAETARSVARSTSGLAPGLRSVHTLRRLDQAVTAGAISARLAAVLETDWQKEWPR